MLPVVPAASSCFRKKNTVLGAFCINENDLNNPNEHYKGDNMLQRILNWNSIYHKNMTSPIEIVYIIKIWPHVFKNPPIS